MSVAKLDPEPATQPTSAPDEIKALHRIVNILEALDPDTRARAVGWIHKRYHATVEEA